MALLRETALLWLVSRLALLLVSYATLLLLTASMQQTHFPVATRQTIISPGDVLARWQEWDAIYYQQIAQLGYFRRINAAFFPLYPLLIRCGLLLTGGRGVTLVALAISNTATFAALWGLARLASREGSILAARASMRALAVYPLAFFLAVGYGDSLFLALVIWSFHWARERRWALVVPLGVLAGLCRATAIILVLPLAWEYTSAQGWFEALRGWSHWRRECGSKTSLAANMGSPDRLRTPRGTPRPIHLFALARSPARPRVLPREWRFRGVNEAIARISIMLGVMLGVMLAPLLGIGAYALYCYMRFGDALAFLAAERTGFGHSTLWPWQALGYAAVQFAQLPVGGFDELRVLVDALPLVAVAAIVATMIASAARARNALPFSFTLYVGSLLLLVICTPITQAQFPEAYVSAGRYLLAAFPVWLVLGRWMARRPAIEFALLYGAALLQAVLFAFYLSGGWLV